ncbi:uncharacterized protein LOC116109762 [Pistacia vera]|uniref:uncharacterized protein LOC116109762 n=1 Tax=Pistacia vera TaxID=55513 RepID=UPI0012635737|nr:uncharacterized protein LOC116109762 [Pistacia vera]
MAFGSFFYDACIPINVVNSIYLQPLVDAIAAIGLGYKHPNYHASRVNLLRKAKKEVQLLVDSYKKIWENVGCTLMADGWTDNSHRSLIDFMVYCPKGVCFVKLVDASNVVKDAETLLKMFEEVALWIGPNSIVHFVSNNGSNDKAAGRMLSEKYPSITWSSCATHSINLVLKDIAEMDHIVYLVRRASEVTKFIYNHTFLIAWLRKRQGWKEIVRLGATHFATTFIAMRSIHEHKHDLQAMVTERSFVDSRYTKSNKGKYVIDIILDNDFWDDMGKISKVVSPLMRLLRIVDSDEKPTIGYVYDGMYGAKNAIKKLFKNKKRLYKPYTRIIKLRWDRTLHHDIHAAAYYLNPAFKYDEESFCLKLEVMSAFLDTIDSKSSAFNLNKTRKCYKRISLDPIDYESIDKTEGWIVDDEEEEEVSELNYEELEQMLYGEGSIPTGVADHPSFYDSTDGSEGKGGKRVNPKCHVSLVVYLARSASPSPMATIPSVGYSW